MALNAAIVWEVRTTGSANNGGGFKAGATGTDYSQQDAAQDSGTDLACADGDAAAPAITSASHTFDATDVGNIINITEAGTGFTLGRYEIVSVADGAATLDRACGADGVLANGDWYLGGAADHPNTISAVVVAGNTIYIAGGTYVKVGANDFVLDTAVAGSSVGEILWKGYTGSRATAYGTNRPLFDGNSDTTTCLIADQSVNHFYNIRFANATGSGVTSSGASNSYYNCKFSDNGAAGISVTASIKLVKCELNGNTTDGMTQSGGGNADLICCYTHDNTSEGISANGNSGTFVKCYYVIAESNTSHGIYGYRIYNCIGCIAYNNTGTNKDGFLQDTPGGATGNGIFLNNISKDNSRYAFNISYPDTVFNYNCYNGHTTELNGTVAGENDVGDQDPLFTDAANGDFTLQAGSPCLDAGLTLTTNDGVVGTY